MNTYEKLMLEHTAHQTALLATLAALFVDIKSNTSDGTVNALKDELLKVEKLIEKQTKN